MSEIKLLRITVVLLAAAFFLVYYIANAALSRAEDWHEQAVLLKNQISVLQHKHPNEVSR